MTYRQWLIGAASASACVLGQTAFAAGAAATPPASKADQGNVAEVVVTGRFIATGAFSGTKLNIAVADTPMSVSAYTGSFMKAIEVTNISDLYPYMTGVQRAGNTGYDLTLRGFKTSGNDRNAIMTDGLPGLSVRFGSPPTVGAEHVEVVKGPASILYGQVQPGGFVNIITKKPRDLAETVLEGRFDKGIGDFGRAYGGTASIDSTGPITKDGDWLYRFIAETGYDDRFRQDSYERPIYVAPMLTWQGAPGTEVTLQLEYRRVQTHYDTYLVAPHKDIAFVAPIDTSYQEPGDFLREEGKTATILAHHDLNDQFRLNLSYRYVDHKDLARGVDVVAVATDFTEVTRRARGQLNKRTYSFADINVTGDFRLAGIRNQMVAGVDVGRETADLDRLQFFNLPAQYNVSVLNPQIGALPPLDSFPLVNPTTPKNLNDRYTVNDSYGVYVSDLLTLAEQWKLMLGLRYAQEDLKIQEKKLLGVPDNSASTHKWLPMAGLIYQPTSDWSFYVSYSTSYVPVPAGTIDANGVYSFTPTSAHAIEGGVKASLLDKRLSFTAAVFDIRKQNVINTFACSFGTCSDQIGEEQSKGVELEVDAQPLPNWQISGGYSYLDATVRKSNIVQQIGARLANVPHNDAHVWTRYDFEDGPLNGLGLGLGVSYVGDRTGLLPTAKSSALLVLPAYTTADLAVYYKVNDNLDLTLKVTNLFDKRYYESAGFTADIQIVPGEPRTLTLTARTRF